MFTRIRRITIVKVDRPNTKDINKDLQWFSDSLGLFGNRDKEKSCFRVFIILLKAIKKGQGLTSDEIAEKSDLTRGTVIHHINTLAEKGLIIKSNNRYFLRVNNLEGLVRQVQTDLNDMFSQLKDMAEELDKELGLE